MKIRFTIAAVAAVFAAAILVQVPGAPPATLAVPANDNLANAIPLNIPADSGLAAFINTSGALVEGSENQPCGSIGATLWYSWTSPATTGAVVFETASSDFDTVLAIYTGSGFPLTSVQCNDDALPNNKSAISLTYSASTTYWIQVGGFNGATGDAALHVAHGAVIVVGDLTDNNAADSTLSLREAILLARGGTGAAGINRALDPSELFQMFNANAVGSTGSDVVHFSPATFPPSDPASILLPPAGSGLPTLDSSGDTITGLGAGVIVDGQNTTLFDCLRITGGSNQVEGIEVRRCSTGRAGIGVDGGGLNVIGGSITPKQRNVVRENDTGIFLVNGAFGNAVLGNYVGTDRTGMLKLGNSSRGIYVAHNADANAIGGVGPNEGNLISNNGVLSNGAGMHVEDGVNGTVVYGNKIGTDVTGAGAMPNGYGVVIQFNSSLNTIGGVSAGQGNVIANSVNNGIRLEGANTIQNTLRDNAIYGNFSSGIDLLQGANASLPAPAITSVTGGVVSGFACSLCTVDVYNDAGSQGRVYLGADVADVGGSFNLSGAAHSLANLTATSTDAAGNTSEFSLPFPAPPNSDGDGLADSSDGCPFDPEDVDGFEDGDGCPDTDNDVDGVLDTADTGKLCFDPAGTLSCGTIDCRNMAEDLDAFKDSDGCPEPDNDNDGFPDSADDCPGAALHTGPDGMLGAPQDLNHNGRRDVNPPDPTTEAVFTTDDVFKLMFEDYDAVLDTDGCHDSPGEDFDGDGFTDDAEALTIGTNAGYPCGGNSWPADLLDQGPLSANKITLQDLASFVAPVRHLNTSPGNPNFNARWDLVPGKGVFANTINLQDMAAIVILAPPMLNGARALNGPSCPMPSQ